MSEKDLADALRDIIAGGLSSPPDPRQLAAEIIRRDKWRVQTLAGLSIFFWLLAVAGLILFVVALDRFVIFVRVTDLPGAPPGNVGKLNPQDPLTPAQIERLHGTSLLHHSLPVVGGAVVALLLAALCTVLLVFSSRRATLRHIQLSLMTISEQLKELQRAPAPESERGPRSA
jgi:hypothetical protein